MLEINCILKNLFYSDLIINIKITSSFLIKRYMKYSKYTKYNNFLLNLAIELNFYIKSTQLYNTF